jgi:hypothetical protein
MLYANGEAPHEDDERIHQWSRTQRENIMTARHSKKTKSIHTHAKSHRHGKNSARRAIGAVHATAGSSGRMRLGWLVAFAMVVTMAVATCAWREEGKQAPALDSTLDAFADAGAVLDGVGSVVQG